MDDATMKITGYAVADAAAVHDAAASTLAAIDGALARARVELDAAEGQLSGRRESAYRQALRQGRLVNIAGTPVLTSNAAIVAAADFERSAVQPKRGAVAALEKRRANARLWLANAERVLAEAQETLSRGEAAVAREAALAALPPEQRDIRERLAAVRQRMTAGWR